MEETQQRAPVLKYVGIFLLVWIVLTLLVGTIAAYLSIPKDIVGIFLAITMAGAACFAGDTFIKDHDRLPSDGERKRLFWYSFILPGAINALTTAAVYLADIPETAALREGPVILNAVLTVVVFILMVALPIYIGYGWALNKVFNRYQENKK